MPTNQWEGCQNWPFGKTNKMGNLVPSVLSFNNIVFTLGLTASLFFDYRAVANYAKKVVDSQKVENLSQGYTKVGVEMSSAEDRENSLNKQHDSILNTLNSIRDRLRELGEERKAINEDISSYKEQKSQKGISKKDILKLNSNIYTSRKQLEALSIEEEKLLTREKNYEKKLEKLEDKNRFIAKEKKAIISNANMEAEEEKRMRIILMYVFIVFIEIASFSTLIADFLANKNVSQEAREKAHTIRKNNSQAEVINRELDAIIAKQIQRTGQRVALTGHIMDTFGATAVLQQASTAKMIGTTAGAVMNANEAAVQGQEALMEAQIIALKGKMADTRASKMEEFVKQLIEEEKRNENDSSKS